MKRLVIAGAGGHAGVVADIVRLSPGLSLEGATAAGPASVRAAGPRLKRLGTDAALPALRRRGVSCAAVGVGAVKDTAARARIFALLKRLRFELPPLVHPRAVVAASARLGEGSQVMAGAVVNPGAAVGAGAVVNTGAVVEHDCRVGPQAFLGPGCRLGGQARIGAGAFVGMGAVVLPGVRVGAGSLVGAGAVVTADVPARRRALGVPARTSPL